MPAENPLTTPLHRTPDTVRPRLHSRTLLHQTTSRPHALPAAALLAAMRPGETTADATCRRHQQCRASITCIKLLRCFLTQTGCYDFSRPKAPLSYDQSKSATAEHSEQRTNGARASAPAENKYSRAKNHLIASQPHQPPTSPPFPPMTTCPRPYVCHLRPPIGRSRASTLRDPTRRGPILKPPRLYSDPFSNAKPKEPLRTARSGERPLTRNKSVASPLVLS